MINLDATTKKLQVVLGGAITTNQLDITSSYVDVSQSDFAMTGAGTTNIASNSTTAVDIVAAPAVTTTRQVKYIKVYNNDTVSATVTIRYNNNGTNYILWKGILATGEWVEYVA